MNWVWKRALTLSVVFAALTGLAAGPQSAPPSSVRFLGVTVDETAEAETRLDVTTSQPTTYHIFRLENPKRLVLDLENAQFPAGQRTYPAQGPLIDRVRLGQLKARGVPVVRVVADLKQPCAFDVKATSTGVLETLWSTDLKTPAPAPAVSPASVAAPPDRRAPLLSDPAAAASAPAASEVHVPAPTQPVPLVPPRDLHPPSGASDKLMPSAIPVPALWHAAPLDMAIVAAPEPNLATSAITDPVSPAAGVSPAQRVVNRPAAQLQGSGSTPEATVEAHAAAEKPASEVAPASPETSGLHPAASVPEVQSRGSLGSGPTGAASLSLAQFLPPDPKLISPLQALSAQTPVPAPNAAGQTAGGPSQPETQYTGEKISLNLKDVDLKDFFRLIHEISGLNIIVDPNVSGTLTLALDDVPWDQALDIVLRNNGLNKVLEGNVLRIARNDTLAAEADNQAKLAQSQAAAAPLITVVRYLSYATAADVQLNNAMVQATGGATGGGITAATSIFGVASILMKMKSAIMSPRGMVTADPRDNAVVITDIPEQIPIIQAVIDKLDVKSRQISIEARIILTTNDVVRQIQTVLNTQILNHSGSVAAGGVTGSGASASPTTEFPVASNSGRLGLTQTSVSGFGAFALSNIGGLYAINAAISAAENKNLAKTISAPTIVTQNNVPGLVQQGTQLFIQTTINNTVTSAPVNASLALAVTPQITQDGHIFLNIQVQNDSPGPVLPGTTNPEINIQGATTQVLVQDGGVVVFGGIKVTANTRSLTQVPGLASIPIFGNFFKSTSREDQENELLFIVTPKIIPG